MIYSELELKRMVNSGLGNLSLEDEIKFNILNFIHCIYLNKQDFIKESFNSEMFGNLGMVFKKQPNQLFGIIRINIKETGEEKLYIFNNYGYELLDNIINCGVNGF